MSQSEGPLVLLSPKQAATATDARTPRRDMFNICVLLRPNLSRRPESNDFTTKKTAAARHLFPAGEKTFVGARLAREIAKRRRWLRTTICRGERHDPDASVTDEPLRVDFDPFE
jgi:hypothetical protein